jgi:hypothetical protein
VTIYIDANFILQSAWVQEDVPAVTEIYVRVRGRQLKLKCPAVAIGEVVAQVANRNARRGDFRDLLMGHRVMDDLSRSGLHLDAVRKVRDIADYLKDMRSDEEARVDAELQRFFDAGGEVLPLLPHCFSTASQLRGNPDNRMRLADSYVAATILVDLYSIRKLHPNQNDGSVLVTGDKGFAHLGRELQSLGCKLITNYRNAAEYITHASRIPEGGP